MSKPATLSAGRSFWRGFHLTWYRGQGFPRPDGITWVRIKWWTKTGPGLWWRDSRIAPGSPADASGWKLPIGPYRVRLLGRNR